MAARSYMSTPARYDSTAVESAYRQWRTADDAYAQMALGRILARYRPGQVAYPTNVLFERQRLMVRLLRGIFYAYSSPKKVGNVTVAIDGVNISITLEQALACVRCLQKGGSLQLIQTSTGDSIRLINE